MVFDYEDLPKLTLSDVTNLQLPGSPTIDLTHQPSNGAFQMLVSQYMGIKKENRIDFEGALASDPTALGEITNSQEKMTAIFPTKQTFLDLFPDITTLRYASHVRNVRTEGCPGSGIDETGVYSIIVSSRMANYAQTTSKDPAAQKPYTQIVHLVSIENFERLKRSINDALKNAKDAQAKAAILGERVALTSLYSWTYLALPPNPVNFIDSLKNCIAGMQMLRAPKSITDVVSSQSSTTTDVKQAKALTALSQRLIAGYTLSRWRCETGEETVAYNRGPLVPARNDLSVAGSPNVGTAPVPDWPTHSNTSKEYQILDTTTGIMDLSYSSAWQLGKTLAISDTSFSAALSRFRSFIQTTASAATRAQVNNMSSRKALLQRISANLKTVDSMATGGASDPRRVTQLIGDPLAPPLDHPDIAPIFRANVKDAVLKTASTAGGELYNEFNQTGHNNTDWTIILAWISEKLYLYDIPAHVLIPDPSYLPEESLRWFHIDDTWMDCLIDGALSVANHLEKDSDIIREEIKQVYNAYLQDTTLPSPPQTPRFGFILRSQVVKALPDLKINVSIACPTSYFIHFLRCLGLKSIADGNQVQWAVEPHDGSGISPYCRYIRPDDHTLMCLLDRPPEDLNYIELAQPPHQQRFAFGHTISPPDPAHGVPSFQVEIEWRKMFTDGTAANPEVWSGLKENQPTVADSALWFNLNTRVVDFSKVASAVNDRLRKEMNLPGKNPQYTDYVPSSAELALELNDPCYFFHIEPDQATKSNAITPRNRQLWCEKSLPPLDPSSTSVPQNPPDSKGIGDKPPAPSPADTIEPTHQPNLNGDVPASANPKIIFKDSDPVPADAEHPLTTSTFGSKFSVVIYADYKSVPKFWPKDGPLTFDKDNYLPTKNDNLYDLIVSVRKVHNEHVDYDMREIIINIPTTGPKNREALIDDTQLGPRARMLSNQRFVPLLNWTAEYLQVRLVPRSAKDHPTISLMDNRTTQISFRLEDVAIPLVQHPVRVAIHDQIQPTLGCGLATVFVYERYVPKGGGIDTTASPVGQVRLVKRDVRDEVPVN